MWWRAVLALVLLFSTAQTAAAIEEPDYRVEQKYPEFEIRGYTPYLVAETKVDSAFEDAADQGFRRLFRYIAGENTARRKIEMTAPVIQAGQKIDMAAPVIQSGASGSYAVSFVMPRSWTAETIPLPTDKSISLRVIPASRMAVVRYSGTWSVKNYEASLARLRTALSRANLTAAGEPLWARYDPPFMPWFLRRNEILIPLEPAIAKSR